MNIKLKYTINGAKFRREYAQEHYIVARARIEALREQGIAVKVTGWPKQLVFAVPRLAAR